ncbi:MAG: hypothetical protein R2849_18925 [Thermomicrobiales bacterium]
MPSALAETFQQSSMVLDEALKMRHIPWIYFADTPSGRTAKVAGSGLGIWEIIMGYRSVDKDWARLQEG